MSQSRLDQRTPDVKVKQGAVNPSEWVDLYGDHLFRVALARVRDKAVAEDLVQDTFLAALKSLESFEGRSSLESWLQSILRNKVIDHFRSVAARKGDISMSESSELSALPFNALGIWNTFVSNWARDPEKALEDQQFLSVLQGCVGKLPGAHRIVFELRFIKELEQDEICKAARVSPSNYWVILHRARLALRECVERNWVTR